MTDEEFLLTTYAGFSIGTPARVSNIDLLFNKPEKCKKCRDNFNEDDKEFILVEKLGSENSDEEYYSIMVCKPLYELICEEFPTTILSIKLTGRMTSRNCESWERST